MLIMITCNDNDTNTFLTQYFYALHSVVIHSFFYCVKLNPVLYQNVEKLPVHNVGSCSPNVLCCASGYVLNHLLKLQQKGLIEKQ